MLGRVTSDVATRVLVVEDDQAVRDLVAKALEMEGIESAVAADAAQALALCREAVPFSLVLLDWRLGQATGQEFAGAYRTLPGPHAPIVLVTGAGDVVESAEEIGAQGFLRKPFDLEELIEMVQRFGPVESAAKSALAAGGEAPARSPSAVAGQQHDERQRRLRWMAG